MPTKRSERAAFWCFVVYVAVALPLILLRLGAYHWFFGDEWSFLAERDAGNAGDLFRAHGEHWVTIPVLVYRALFSLFGLRTYLPYQGVVVVAHLATALLLRFIMRRAGVGPWTATIVAAVFVLFGPGEENIVWAFQIGFVGALMFGLVHLILSDHDGPIGRADWLGLLAGAASLMCSGVSLVLVAVVGLAALLRRGWLAAAFHTMPLGVLYAVWYLFIGPGGIENPYGRQPYAGELARFVWSGVRGTFVAVGGVWPIGILVAGALILGTVLSVRAAGPAGRERLVAPLVLLVGAAVFLLATGYARWYVTPIADNQSRYLYTLAALVLPAVGVAIEALGRRWPLTRGVMLPLLLVASVENIGVFGARGGPWSSHFHERHKQLIQALAHADLAQRVPGYFRLFGWFTIGWLREVASRGDLPVALSPPPEIERQLPLLLGATQLREKAPRSTCRRVGDAVTLAPARGDRFGFSFANHPPVGANWLVQNALTVTRLSPDGRPLASVTYKSEFGSTVEIGLDGLVLRVQAANPQQDLLLCPFPGTSLPIP